MTQNTVPAQVILAHSSNARKYDLGKKIRQAACYIYQVAQTIVARDMHADVYNCYNGKKKENRLYIRELAALQIYITVIPCIIQNLHLR